VDRLPEVPAANGELAAVPPIGTWGARASEGLLAARSSGFEVCGRPVTEAIADARLELVKLAFSYSSGLGVVQSGGSEGAESALAAGAPIVVAGHQPGFVHPGVWVKYFAIQRVSDETGAIAIDLVVDTDSVKQISATLPRADGEVSRTAIGLCSATTGTYPRATSVPGERSIAEFLAQARTTLKTFPEATALHQRLERFSGAMYAASVSAGDMGSFLTATRRRYEGDRNTYLELPVSSLSRSAAYLEFAAALISDAGRFAHVHNSVLAEYRKRHGIRTAAQPFPDLKIADHAIEAPFWLLVDGRRERVFVREARGRIELVAGSVTRQVPRRCDLLAEVLAGEEHVLAPRALTLTMFARTMLADLFVHGIGGARYDRVTDAVASSYWGEHIQPYAAVTLTMHAPLGMPVVSAEAIAEATRAVTRITRKPDEFLGEAGFESVEASADAFRLAAEKRALVDAISAPGANRRSLGARIRAVNDELAIVLAPYAATLAERRDALRAELATAEVLTDRTYPYFLWDPEKIERIVRVAP